MHTSTLSRGEGARGRSHDDTWLALKIHCASLQYLFHPPTGIFACYDFWQRLSCVRAYAYVAVRLPVLALMCVSP